MKQSCIVTTDEQKCAGCNRCILFCPVPGANISEFVNGESKTHVLQERCIQCGRCIEVCNHNARDYADDTEMFFEHLKSGKPISLLVAPSFKANYPNYGAILAMMKKMGVVDLIDVSLGADITTWAYLRVMERGQGETMIAQPCPAVVNYIERYQPDLIPLLSQVHSPLLCTAVYARSYLNKREAFAFLSPCIAKNQEIHDADTKGYVQYNVTFKKFMEYLQHHALMPKNTTCELDYQADALGGIFSLPGGLRENVALYAPDAWVKQVEGCEHAYAYINELGECINTQQVMPHLVDILSCPQGCNRGSGTEKKLSITALEAKMHEIKLQYRKMHADEDANGLLLKYDRMLRLDDFVRSYRPRNIAAYRCPSDCELEEIFVRMGKLTEESRHRNCNACGYGDCREMAVAIYNDYNHVHNCIDYNLLKSVRLDDLEEKNRIIESISARIIEHADTLDCISVRLEDIVQAIEHYMKLYKRNCADIEKISMKTKLLSMNAGLEASRAGAVGAGFYVVAKEIKSLSLQTDSAVKSTNDETLRLQEIVERYRELADTLKHISKSFIDDSKELEMTIRMDSGQLPS